MREEHPIRERTPDERKEQQRALQKKFLRWVFFSFVLSLSPLFIQMGILAIKKSYSSFPMLIQNGELLLISATMCIGGIGELVRTGNNYDQLKLSVLALSIIAAFFATAFFGAVAAFAVTKDPIDYDMVVILSFWIYGASVILSVSDALLAEL